jgi:hypothetical protein
MDRPIDCLVCGAELQYRDTSVPMSCSYCGSEHQSTVDCSEGHFICDSCHSLSAIDLIQTYCLNSDSIDVFGMADMLMNNPAFHMHGPEHHFLVPAVLLTAYYNIIGHQEEKEQKLAEARKRAFRVPGGFCGTHGSCGAGIGTGMYISLILESTPLAQEEWGLSNRMTAQSLATLGRVGGPRCCKRTTFLSLNEAVAFTEEHLHTDLGRMIGKRCSHHELNRECIGRKCPFFPRE